MSARQFELIFGLLTIPKSELVEVQKAMFQGLACQFELIFSLLTFPKCDLAEFHKAKYQGLAWHFQLIIGPAQNVT